jgi:hypothetical protein
MRQGLLVFLPLRRKCSEIHALVDRHATLALELVLVKVHACACERSIVLQDACGRTSV